MTERKRKRDLDYLLGRTPNKPEVKGFIAQYLCLSCDAPFVSNPTLGKIVSCPRCRSTRCEAKSPAVRVTASAKVVTQREFKKMKFTQRSEKLLRQLHEQRTSFLAFLKLLGVDESVRTDSAVALDKALEAAKQTAMDKQSKY